MTTDCEERLEIVTTIERAEEIAGAWADLWQDAQALVFQNHAWIMGWWKERPRSTGRCRSFWLGVAKTRCGAAAGQAAPTRSPDARMVARTFPIIAMQSCAPASIRSCCGGCGAAVASRRLDVVQLNRFLPTRRRASCSVTARSCARTRARAKPSRCRPWAGSQAWFDQQTKKLRQNYRRGVKVMSETPHSAFACSATRAAGAVLGRLAELKRLWLARTASRRLCLTSARKHRGIRRGARGERIAAHLRA